MILKQRWMVDMKLGDLIDPIARAILARAQQKERTVEADELEKEKK